MNSLAKKFYEKGGVDGNRFFSVRFLSEEPEAKWSELEAINSDLPRSWFELSRISAQDRVEFVSDLWLDRFPYHPSAHPVFAEFFEQLDDVAVVLVQKEEEGPFQAELVYSFADNSTFFRGRSPCTEEDLLEMRSEVGVILPRDYLAFLKIHSGFGKMSEMGLLEASKLADAKRHVAHLIIKSERPLRSGDRRVDLGSLIPFFEVLGLDSYQCFYTDWYPGNEMGNVYLSGIDYKISDTSHKKALGEELAFPSFSDWFAFYLQGMSCT